MFDCAVPNAARERAVLTFTAWFRLPNPMSFACSTQCDRHANSLSRARATSVVAPFLGERTASIVISAKPAEDDSNDLLIFRLIVVNNG